MLCRALLAAVALSCTLTIRAQATGRLTQIKDLICVLVLSGMQKEDLEISMLQKLQRYDVNLDDLNNGKLRHDCQSTNKDLTKDFSSTTESISTRTTSTAELIIVSTTEDPFNGLGVEKILNFLKARRDQLPLNQTTTEKYTSTQQDVTPASVYFINRSKIDLNLLQRYLQLTTTYKPTTNEDTFETTSRLNIDEYIYSNILNRNQKDTKNAEFINKAFKDFLRHHMTTTTTEKITTKPTIEINDIYEQISKLIKLRNDSNKSIERQKATEKLGYSYAEKNVDNVTSSDAKGIDKDNTDNERNKGIKTFYDFITVINQFKTYFPLTFSPNDSMILPQNHSRRLESIINNTAPVSTAKPDQNISKTPVDQTELKLKVFSSNLVQEIAKNIKDVIIKDLRKELSSVYFKPTETISTLTSPPPITTSAAPTKKPPEIILQEKELSKMGTFIELYDRIKTMKQSFFVLPVNNITENFKEELKSQTLFPTMQMMNKFNDPQPKVSFLPIKDYTRQLGNANPYLPRNRNNKKKYQRPLTIQTNSIEIKPLALPLPKPENLVRENIIINTRQTFRSRDNNHVRHIPWKNRNFDVRNDPTNRNNMQNSMKQNYEYAAPYIPSHYTHQVPTHNREDIIRVTMSKNGNSGLDTDYYEKINIGNHNNGGIERSAMFRQHNIPRFHERLERLDDRGSGILDRDISDKPDTYQKQQKDTDDVASRQQLSLIDMKKGKNYDDRHFKNFLKTQEKVTDILEKILASKTKSNMPRSVEFA